MTTSAAVTPYVWLNHELVSNAEVFVINPYFRTCLIKIGYEAILSWCFEEDDPCSDDPTHYTLLVHLTDDEAQTVYERGSGGMLEGIRANLLDADAMVVVANSLDFAARHIRIRSDVSEEDFLADLWDTAARLHRRIASHKFPRDWESSSGDLSLIRKAIDFHRGVHRD